MASQGPLSAGTGASGGGGWLNPGSITTSNDSYATADMGAFSSSNTDILRATNFGFSIPTGATIDGIVCEWEQGKSTTDVNLIVYDSSVRLYRGAAVGTDKSAAANWPAADTYASFGGEADLWGTTWTAEQINASTFGTQIAAGYDNFTGDDHQARVDHVRITVYYTESTGNRRRRALICGWD